MSGYPGTDELRRRVDDVLEAFLAAAAAEVPAGDERRLVDEVARVVHAGGKRLRPAFCYWGYRAGGGGDDPAIVRLAASLELLHTFAIVHDDVMDASSLRRGEATVQNRFAGEAGRRADSRRFGDSAAVLVGDLAFALADELFVASGFDGAALQRGLVWFAAMRREVIRGQFLDLVEASRGGTASTAARRIAFLKSGGYTVEKPLLIGAAVAGADEDVLAALSRYGAPLGEAFQLRDDVLGVFGDPGDTGKDVDGDILEGKQTYLVAVARERSTVEQRSLIEHHLGRRDATPADVEALREILVETGALDATTELIDELTEGAIAVARTFPNEIAIALEALALTATVRTS